jgi:MFS family permease
MASAFGGILAYGLMQMDGRDNLSGWRWIFIVSFNLLSTSFLNVTDNKANASNFRLREY